MRLDMLNLELVIGAGYISKNAYEY